MKSEEWKEFYKRNKMLLLLIVMSTIVLVGSSYAWYQVSFASEKEQTITAGTLSLLLSEQENGIRLTSAVPQTDEEGIENPAYTFTIKNNGTLSSNYTITLEDLELATGVTRMDDSKIKYVLKKESYSNGIAYLSSLPKDEEKNRILAKGTIAPEEKVTYSIVLWIDEKAGNEIFGHQFKAKIKLKGEQLKGVPNEPELIGDMIPVVYDGTNWVKASVVDGTWYDYDNQKWANVVTIQDANKRATYKNANVGTAIAMEDINTFLVWIPRYSYTMLWLTDEHAQGSHIADVNANGTSYPDYPGAFQIKFIGKTTIDTGAAKWNGGITKEYYTPSSFCFGETCDDDTHRSDTGNIELSGIWVSKFEMTGTINDIESVPSATSIANQTVSEFFTGIQTTMNGDAGTSKYGFHGNYDTHMIKNTEWGAVAYLSQSKYGKYGNKDYSAADKEIYQNRSYDSTSSKINITGCSYGKTTAAGLDQNADHGCQYQYKDGKEGTGASTTGTIYGIYDMSGGAYEYVMGNFGDNLGSSGFTSMKDKKYYNFYDNTTLGIKGDAMKIDGSNGFYQDAQNYFTGEFSWMSRGGGSKQDNVAGIFYFSPNNGSGVDTYSTRFVLIKE